MVTIRLTQFSPGAGCGCKIAPKILEEILQGQSSDLISPKLLVGHDEKDDAAVYDLDNGTALISTTDFFTPIVDDPFDYGRIAATNALSDVYAMGGKPLLAIAILGWPVDKLPPEVAGTVVQGARRVCTQNGIPLAGGHSIDIQDPVFGLAVTGIVELKYLKRNSTATPECRIYLTKPLGIGIISTAEKKGLARPEHLSKARDRMLTPNAAGSLLATLPFVTAMTDVTGFGLAGHLLEMCEGSGIDAVIDLASVPVMEGIEDYIRLNTIPGGTYRNFKSYGEKISPINQKQKMILCDPQTSGGLLLAVKENHSHEFERFCKENNIPFYSIGHTLPHAGNTIRIMFSEA